MKREDYIFTIGFEGNCAIVDKRTRSMYKHFDTRALADEGLFRAAYRSTVFERDEEGAKYVLEKYNSISPIKYDDAEELTKVFGVQAPSNDITSVRII